MSVTGFYPGSFDPVTYGHLDIIARSTRLVGRLVLGVGTHHGKNALLGAEERLLLLVPSRLRATKPTARPTRSQGSNQVRRLRPKKKRANAKKE